MLPSLLVAAAITAPGAPVPKDAVPNTTGPAPRVVAVKADASGAVWITAQIAEMRKVQQQYFVIENGKQVPKQQEIEQLIYNNIHKTIGEFGGKFTTAGGTALTTEEATKRLKDGATLLVTADGKPVDKSWLRPVSPDTVVMVAEGLAHAHFQFNQGYNVNGPAPNTAAPRLTMFCSDDAGAVKVAVNPNSGNNYGQQVYYDDFGGGGRVVRGRAVMIQNNIEWDGTGYNQPQGGTVGSNSKKLADVKFDAYDMAGRMVSKNEALKRLKAGGLVLLAGDNRFPDPEYLKAFREDLLVLVSGEFVFPINMTNPYDMAVKPTAATQPAKTAPAAVPALPAIQVVPAGNVKIAPAVIKRLQVAPANVAPAAEKPVAKPEEKPAEKPAAKPVEKPAKP